MSQEPEDTLLLYATCWCGECALARRFLKSRGVAWSELDVDEDVEADGVALRHNRGARLLPVFEWRGERLTVCPFDRRRLAAWLLRTGAAQAGQVQDLVAEDHLADASNDDND